MSNSIFLGGKIVNYFRMYSAEIVSQHAKRYTNTSFSFLLRRLLSEILILTVALYLKIARDITLHHIVSNVCLLTALCFDHQISAS